MPREAEAAARGWLALVAVSLLSLSILFAAFQPAQATVGPPLSGETLAVLDIAEDDGEEESEEEEEGGEEDGKVVGEEEFEEEEGEAGPFPPAECLLRTARARLFTYSDRDQIRLVVRYTSLASAQVTVDYVMKGKKGPLSLGRAKQRFHKRGVLRHTDTLSDAEMAKVRAAKSFFVSIRIPAAPSYCEQFYSRRLTIKRTVKNQVVWLQSDSIFG